MLKKDLEKSNNEKDKVIYNILSDISMIVDNKKHWKDMYFKMKAKKNSYREDAKTLIIVGISTVFTLNSLLSIFGGKFHLFIVFGFASISFHVWGLVRFLKTLKNNK